MATFLGNKSFAILKRTPRPVFDTHKFKASGLGISLLTIELGIFDHEKG